jgi:hypothetical protein
MTAFLTPLKPVDFHLSDDPTVHSVDITTDMATNVQFLMKDLGVSLYLLI